MFNDNLANNSYVMNFARQLSVWGRREVVCPNVCMYVCVGKGKNIASARQQQLDQCAEIAVADGSTADDFAHACRVRLLRWVSGLTARVWAKAKLGSAECHILCPPQRQR